MRVGKLHAANFLLFLALFCGVARPTDLIFTTTKTLTSADVPSGEVCGDLIVNGDLTIDSSLTQLKVTGNVLVYGSLTVADGCTLDVSGRIRASSFNPGSGASVISAAGMTVSGSGNVVSMGDGSDFRGASFYARGSLGGNFSQTIGRFDSGKCSFRFRGTATTDEVEFFPKSEIFSPEVSFSVDSFFYNDSDLPKWEILAGSGAGIESCNFRSSALNFVLDGPFAPEFFRVEREFFAASAWPGSAGEPTESFRRVFNSQTERSFVGELGWCTHHYAPVLFANDFEVDSTGSSISSDRLRLCGNPEFVAVKINSGASGAIGPSVTVLSESDLKLDLESSLSVGVYEFCGGGTAISQKGATIVSNSAIPAAIVGDFRTISGTNASTNISFPAGCALGSLVGCSMALDATLGGTAESKLNGDSASVAGEIRATAPNGDAKVHLPANGQEILDTVSSRVKVAAGKTATVESDGRNAGTQATKVVGRTAILGHDVSNPVVATAAEWIPEEVYLVEGGLYESCGRGDAPQNPAFVGTKTEAHAGVYVCGDLSMRGGGNAELSYDISTAPRTNEVTAAVSGNVSLQSILNLVNPGGIEKNEIKISGGSGINENVMVAGDVSLGNGITVADEVGSTLLVSGDFASSSLEYGGANLRKVKFDVPAGIVGRNVNLTSWSGDSMELTLNSAESHLGGEVHVGGRELSGNVTVATAGGARLEVVAVPNVGLSTGELDLHDASVAFLFGGKSAGNWYHPEEKGGAVDVVASQEFATIQFGDGANPVSSELRGSGQLWKFGTLTVKSGANVRITGLRLLGSVVIEDGGTLELDNVKALAGTDVVVDGSLVLSGECEILARDVVIGQSGQLVTQGGSHIYIEGTEISAAERTGGTPSIVISPDAQLELAATAVTVASGNAVVHGGEFRVVVTTILGNPGHVLILGDGSDAAKNVLMRLFDDVVVRGEVEMRDA